MAKRRYSKEYKQEAVALTELPGAAIAGVAYGLAINGHILGPWRKQIESHYEKSVLPRAATRTRRLRRSGARTREL